MNYYPRHIGDYLKDTSHLSLLEHGIYTRLLDVYYSREKAFENGDEAARYIGARSKEEKAALQCVLDEFFWHDDGGAYRQSRCDREIEAYLDKQGKARAAAEMRWAQQPKKSERNADAMRTHSEGNAPNNQEPITKNQQEKKTPSPSAPGFEEFWSAYPKKVGKDAALKAFAKRKPDEGLLAQMLSALKTQAQSFAWAKNAGEFIPNPSTWLNEGRWQDEGVTAPQEVPRTYYTPPPPPTPEERARADAARKLAVSSIRNITRAA